jgi:YD repeat-containing protein
VTVCPSARRAEVTDAQGTTTGNVLSHAATYAYDALHRLTAQTDTATTAYTYARAATA